MRFQAEKNYRGDVSAHLLSKARNSWGAGDSRLMEELTALAESVLQGPTDMTRDGLMISGRSIAANCTGGVFSLVCEAQDVSAESSVAGFPESGAGN